MVIEPAQPALVEGVGAGALVLAEAEAAHAVTTPVPLMKSVYCKLNGAHVLPSCGKAVQSEA
jgi:hypothetical protein